MRAIPYQIRLLEPLLATRVAGDPNSAVSFPYVPGSTVRGALIAAYIHTNGLSALDAGDEEAQRIFFDGRTRCLHAYPVTPRNERMLPTPRSWFTVKGEASPVYDFAHEVQWEVRDEPRQFSAVAGDARSFCWVSGEAVSFHAPQRRVNIHTQRDRVRGRATKSSGAVFQYDALNEGEVLAGLILVDNPDDAPLIASLLDRSLRLGGSSNSGYGRVRVEVGTTIDLSQQHWRETPGNTTALAPGETFVVTLLSDVLVRDPSMGSCTPHLKPALERALGGLLQTLPSPANVEEEQRSGWSMEEVGGFNRTWGLPLPQAHALSAGSVFVFSAMEQVDVTSVAVVEWRGIGERRAEGFGRLAINWQTEAVLAKIDTRRLSAQTPSIVLSGTAEKMAMAMAKRMLRRDLDLVLRKRINVMEIKHASAISNAQLSRFRVVAREALSTGDTERLLEFLTGIRERRSTRDQFEKARISNQRLIDWLEAHLNNPAQVWQDIGALNLEKRLGSNVYVRANDDEALAREYTIRLIDGLLAKMAQTRRREQEENE